MFSRRGTIIAIVFFAVSAAYDFIRQGWGSLSAVAYSLLALGSFALAPLEDEPREGGSRWSYVFHSPRYTAGAVAFVTATAILLFRFRE